MGFTATMENSVLETCVNPGVDTEDALVFECGQWSLAIQLSLVERIVTDEDLVKVKIDKQPRIARGFHGIVRSRHVQYALWDVGDLLGQKMRSSSVVLLRLCGVLDDTVSIALRVGRCVSVGPLPSRGLASLPRKLTKMRQGAFDLAFDQSKVHGMTKSVIGGLRMDLQKVWSEREVHQMQSLLREVMDTRAC